MDKTDYRDRLQTLMDKAGMDRTRLAAALGISYQAVRKVFENNAKFGVMNNLRAAEYFCVSSDWLATGKGQVEAPPVDVGLSPGAIEIGTLYDMIPASDRIRRAKAYTGAIAAIVSVLENHATEPQATDQKKLPA